MLQTCCAISRKHSAQDRRQILSNGKEQVGHRPIEDHRIGLLDISNSSLEQLPIELLSEQAKDIEHLILDENQLDEKALEEIPELPNLKTLSLNGNSVQNCGVLFQVLCRKVPQIVCLSLIGNPGWPHPILNGNNLQLYRKYALSAAKLFPTLQFLDTTRVSTNLRANNKEGGVIATQNSSMGTFVATPCHII